MSKTLWPDVVAGELPHPRLSWRMQTLLNRTRSLDEEPMTKNFFVQEKLVGTLSINTDTLALKLTASILNDTQINHLISMVCESCRNGSST